MSETLLEEVSQILAAGDEITGMLGLLLTVAIEGTLEESDIPVIREAILSWRRISGSYRQAIAETE